MIPDMLTRWAGTNPAAAVAVAVALAVAALVAVRAARKAVRRHGTPAAVVVAAAAAVACTMYSADTSWRFAAHRLDMVSTTERAAMFAAGELALFACALMARHNLRTAGAPGTPGVLVWLVTAVQVFAAYAEGGPVGGTVRAILGPVMGALLWHLAMGIEVRHHKPGSDSQSLPAVVLREVRERLLSWLGLAKRGRDAEQITRDRWTVRAVDLAARLAEIPPARRDGRRARRIARRLSVAVGNAQAGASSEQRRMLLDLLAARRHATALATVALPSPWDVETGVEVTRGTTAETAAGPAVLPRLITVPLVPELAPVPLPGPVTETPQTAPVYAVNGHRPAVASVVTGTTSGTTTEPTPGQRRQAARRINRQAIRETGRPVTVDRLRAELGLSRREAAELRREVVGGSPTTGTDHDQDHDTEEADQ